MTTGGLAWHRRVSEEFARNNGHKHLTPRQIEILGLMAQGMENKEVACAADITIETVKTYTHDIFRKLGVQNRVQAINEGYRRGYLDFNKVVGV